MTRAIFAGVAIICAIGLSACGKSDEISYIQETDNNISEYSQPGDSTEEELQASEPVEVEEETSVPSETKLAQIQLQVYIQPDMPDPFAEMLGQLEEVINLVVQDPSREDVWEKMGVFGSELKFMLEDAYNSWWMPIYDGEEMDARYSLTDLTGDGFPELILGRYCDYDGSTSPKAVCYYNETDGIEMIHMSDYFSMALYEGGVIEYISAGRTRTETFYQFQEETESWQMAVKVVVDWDPWTDSLKGYYWGDNVKDLTDNRPMSEEEYQKIIAQYATEPMELEWTQFVFRSESVD